MVDRLNLDPTWAETGNRYMLKLFRDMLFHQVDERGAPWIDMAHVVQMLNKVRVRLFLGAASLPCFVSSDASSFSLSLPPCDLSNSLVIEMYILQ